LRILGHAAHKTFFKGLRNQTSLRGAGRNKTNLRAYRDPAPGVGTSKALQLRKSSSKDIAKVSQPGAGRVWMTSMVGSRGFEEDSAFGATSFEAVDMKSPVNKISTKIGLKICLPVGFDNGHEGDTFKKKEDILLLSYLPNPTPSSSASATGLGDKGLSDDVKIDGACDLRPVLISLYL
jgi:hypothetical protein